MEKDNSIFRMLSQHDPSEFRLMVDSGAWQAYNNGTKVDIDKYCDFIQTIPSEWETQVVQLDVIADPVKTYDNWQYMMDRGINTIPVFTRGTSLNYLDQFYEHSDIVLFGGMVKGGKSLAYLKWLLQNNQERPTHWLGVTNMDFIRYYKPASVDSSYSNMARVYGRLSYYQGNGKFKIMDSKDFITKPPRSYFDTFSYMGYSTEQIMSLASNEAWHGNQREFIESGRADDGVVKSGERGVADLLCRAAHVYRQFVVEANIGTRIFHANTTANSMIPLFYVHDRFHKSGHVDQIAQQVQKSKNNASSDQRHSTLKMDSRV